MVRVLVTGGSGFVGHALVPALAAAGWDVVVAGRGSARMADTASIRHVAVGDLAGDVDWSAALDGLDAVVHLAARAHVTADRSDDSERIYDAVNHRAAVALFDQASRRRVATFVQLSTALVLGDETRLGVAFSDGSPAAPSGPYARAKRAAEEALGRRAAGGGTKLVILRAPLVCGPGAKGNLAALLRLCDTGLPLPLGRVQNRRTLLSLDNLVSAILAVLSQPSAGCFLLGDAEPISTASLVATMRRGLGRPERLVGVDPRLLSIGLRAAGQGAAARRLLGDLEVDSAGFRATYAWSDAVATTAGIEAMARA